MKNDRGRNQQRRQRKSVHKGTFLYRLVTRSGYVTVRSLPNKLENTNGSQSPSISSSEAYKSGGQDCRANLISAIKSTQVASLPHTHRASLNCALVNSSFKDILKKNWKNNQPFSSTVAEFISHPFKVVTMHQLFNSYDYLEKLMEEVSLLSFDHLHNDLHDFEQTNDLFESPVGSPALQSFLQLLKGPLLDWMQDITGKNLSGKLTATGSKYSYTNYLLCHDDNLSDRSLAFILYLSKDWSKDDGGALQLFKCNAKDEPETIVHSIYPSFGSFAFFEVTSRSYHQVQEILSKDKDRLSINGWFHGDTLPVKPERKIKGPKFNPPISPEGCFFQKWLNPQYLVPQNQSGIKSDFGYELSVSLKSFLLESAYQDLEKALKKKSIVWERCGPPHQRNYEKAKLSTLPPIMQDCVKFLKSKYMFYFLSEVTVDISPDSKTTPLWYLEVQRWSPGDYILAVDNDPSSDITGIDVHLFFNLPDEIDFDSTQVGTVHYLGPDKDPEGFLNENACVLPDKNALFLVAHIAGMKRVASYLNHDKNLHFHKIIATYTQG